MAGIARLRTLSATTTATTAAGKNSDRQSDLEDYSLTTTTQRSPAKRNYEMIPLWLVYAPCPTS